MPVDSGESGVSPVEARAVPDLSGAGYSGGERVPASRAARARRQDDIWIDAESKGRSRVPRISRRGEKTESRLRQMSFA